VICLNFIERFRIKRELDEICKFITTYFGERLKRVTLFGSFNNLWKFRAISDVDLVIILRSSEFNPVNGLNLDWLWDSHIRYGDFSEQLRKLQIKLGCMRWYDVKIVSEAEFKLLDCHYRQNPSELPMGGSIMDDIRNGKVLWTH
jgi:hypothetical protein